MIRTIWVLDSCCQCLKGTPCNFLEVMLSQLNLDTSTARDASNSHASINGRRVYSLRGVPVIFANQVELFCIVWFSQGLFFCSWSKGNVSAGHWYFEVNIEVAKDVRVGWYRLAFEKSRLRCVKIHRARSLQTQAVRSVNRDAEPGLGADENGYAMDKVLAKITSQLRLNCKKHNLVELRFLAQRQIEEKKCDCECHKMC